MKPSALVAAAVCAALLPALAAPPRPSANTGIGCPADDARLSLSQVELTMTDPAWQAARIRFVQERRAVQPRL